MKKKIIFGYWFYIIGAIILTCVLIAGIYLTTMCMIAQPDDKRWIATLVVIIIIVIFWIAVMGYGLIQYVVISEEGVKARCLWCTIRKLKWEDVKEVRFERFYVSVEGAFTSGWYVIDDGVERKQKNGLISKKTHITICATKRARKILETFWREPIIEKVIK